MIDKIAFALTQLRCIKPVVFCLTNQVTMDFVANSLLAIGAAPIMSCDKREISELIQISQAVNINIGTLDADFIARCEIAAAYAKQYQKPLIFDPVGAGASVIRTQSARYLMQFADIVRGNASEIMALSENELSTQGVESVHAVDEAKNTAITLAKTLSITMVISGEKDFITDGIKQKFLSGGSTLMPHITGMGCALTAVIAAFRSVVNDSFEAALIGTAYFGLCGSLSERKTSKPGTFRNIFIDELYAATIETLRQFNNFD